MESISLRNINFSHTVLASSELSALKSKSFSNILSRTLTNAKLTHAIFLPKPMSILEDVNLTMEKGDILCISGKSGEGKSSLLRVIAGLEKATSGEISLFGESVPIRDWNALSMAQKGVGFVFQNNALISDLTVHDNIAVPLRYHKIGTEEDIEQKVQRALLLMLASKFSSDYPYSLSLGMRKRVAVARSWALDAKILLLDEPTAGLDINSRNNFLSLIDNLRELYKTTIIMIINDLHIAQDLNSKISFLIDRKLTPPMLYDEIKNSPNSRIRAMI